VNVISTLSLLVELGNYLEKQGGGTLATITSVAGDRGRRSNYVYGASKAMISTFLEGLEAGFITAVLRLSTYAPALSTRR